MSILSISYFTNTTKLSKVAFKKALEFLLDLLQELKEFSYGLKELWPR